MLNGVKMEMHCEFHHSYLSFLQHAYSATLLTNDRRMMPFMYEQLTDPSRIRTDGYQWKTASLRKSNQT